MEFVERNVRQVLVTDNLAEDFGEDSLAVATTAVEYQGFLSFSFGGDAVAVPFDGFGDAFFITLKDFIQILPESFTASIFIVSDGNLDTAEILWVMGYQLKGF